MSSHSKSSNIGVHIVGEGRDEWGKRYFKFRYRKKLTRAVEGMKLKPLNRNSGRKATVFAAGSFASKHGIAPWTRTEILRAILSCELDHLCQVEEERDDAAVPSVEDLRAKLANYLSGHRAEFINLRKQQPRHGRDELNAVPGYRAQFKGQRYYYLMASQLKDIIGTSPAARLVKEMLAKEGLLDRSNDKKFVVQRRIFKGGKGRENYAWVHAIRAAILKSGK